MEITTSELETRAGRLRPFCNRHSDQAASSSELKAVQNRTAGPVKSYYTFTGTVIKDSYCSTMCQVMHSSKTTVWILKGWAGCGGEPGEHCCILILPTRLEHITKALLFFFFHRNLLNRWAVKLETIKIILQFTCRLHRSNASCLWKSALWP